MHPTIKNKYPGCAGKGGEKGGEHCGSENCPVCTAFGFSKGEKGLSFQGLAQFSDLRILFFPVYSMKGPVWITSPLAIKEFTANLPKVAENKFRRINNECPADLNFGWLLLQPDTTNGKLPLNLPNLPVDDKVSKFCKEHILNNAYLLPDRLFSHIANDNLEIRTSVAIDPLTGAAESGALYTYEAIPRTTLLWFDVFYNDPKYFQVPKWNEEKKENEQKNIIKDDGGKTDWGWIKENVEKGLELIEFMGIGGMGTRGFGRVRVMMHKKEQEAKNEPNSKS
jgi:CRISPR-associated protein Cmr4